MGGKVLERRVGVCMAVSRATGVMAGKGRRCRRGAK